MKQNKAIETEFLSLIKENQGILHKISFAYACKGISGDDLYQEMILQLWKSYPGFKGQAKFSTWMYRVALNTAISLTKRKSLFIDSVKLPAIAVDVQPPFELSEEVKLLYQAIGQLNKIEKAIILLWLEEQSYQEIADTVGLSVNNVSVRLVRMKEKLAKIMQRLQ